MSSLSVNYPMTGNEIVSLLPHTKILTYDEFHKYKNIDDLLYPSGQFVVLYQLESLTMGHWCCVYVNSSSNSLHFFDSYGNSPDTKQKDNVSSKLLKDAYEDKDYLLSLMKNSKYKTLKYNPYRLQAKGVSTCGRFCVVRLWLKHLTDLEFKKFLNSFGGLNPDNVVCLLTNNALRGYPLPIKTMLLI